MERQHTVQAPLTFSGQGLHSGRQVTMTLLPAPENHGIRFKRIDLPGAPVIEAVAHNVVHTARGVSLAAPQRPEATICTIEHLMACLHYFKIDNALVETDAPEVPIMDGSARHFAQALRSAGTREQEAPRRYATLSAPIEYTDPKTGSCIRVEPAPELSVDLTIDFSSQVLGRQSAHYEEGMDFVTEIAPCRTFVFLHEILFLYQNNLIKGGSLDNAIVIVEKELEEKELQTIKSLFNNPDVRQEKGYLNHLQLRFDNECARHKLLDLLGDFYLIGLPLKAKVIASKSGHGINTRMAGLIRQHIMQ